MLKHSNPIAIPASLKEKLGAANDQDAASRLKSLLQAIVSPPFRYSVSIQDEQADEFIASMAEAEIDPKLQAFLEESKEYSKKRPIRRVE